MLKSYNIYMIKLIAWPTLLVTLCLAGIIWLTQSLRYIDFIINRGLAVSDFFYLAILLLPHLLMIVMPVSFFIATVFAYHKLASDSELVVLRASGLSGFQLAIPSIITGLVITLIVGSLSLYIMPLAKRQFKDTQNFLKDNYASVLLQEEVFNSPTNGLTVFVRERDDKGYMKGILVHDSRVKTQSATMMAEAGRLVQTPKGPRFQLTNGLRQEKNKLGQISWLYFDSYGLDLSFYTSRANKRKIGEDEYFIHELFDEKNYKNEAAKNAFLAQAHQRITWPFVSFALGLMVSAVLLKSEFNRRSSWKVTAILSLTALVFVIMVFAVANAIIKKPLFTPGLYFLIFGAIAFCIYMLIKPKKMNPKYPDNIPDAVGNISLKGA